MRDDVRPAASYGAIEGEGDVEAWPHDYCISTLSNQLHMVAPMRCWPVSLPV